MYRTIDQFTSGINILTIGNHQDDWHHRRKGINPAFAPKCIHQMNDIALNKAKDWVQERLELWINSQQSFDVGTEMVLLTISVICKVAFHYDISFQEANEMLTAMWDCVEEFSIKSMINPFRPLATWMLPKRQNAFRQAAQLKEFAQKLMRMHRQSSHVNDTTVLDHIMRNDTYKNDAERISDIVMLLFAGHDTTGYTMAFALMELAKHPNEQTKLREELLQSAKPTYLKCVVSETMRLHPASPLSAIKQLGRDFVTKDGYHLPKGTIAFLAQIALGRDPNIYSNPDEFQPSRWVDPSEEAKQAHFPFSLGKRNCVGQPLAIAELHSILSFLIRNFVFTIEEEGKIEAQGTLRLTDCRLKAALVSNQR